MNMHLPEPPWEIRPLVGLLSGKTTGFMVERIHNPFTQDAKVETLKVDGCNLWSTKNAAQAAIAKATGRAA